MATHLRDNSAVDGVTEVTDAIAAALEADPETRDLAPRWVSMTTRGDDLSTRLRGGRRGARRTRAAVNVRDALWDARIKKMDRELLNDVNGHRDDAAYTAYFGHATANDATRWGIDREVEFGRGILARLVDERSPLGSRYFVAIREATEGLAAASTARTEAVRALGPLFAEQLLFVEDVNTEIDRLEGQLQMRFPRDPKRVASYLSATRRDDTGVADASGTSDGTAGGGTGGGGTGTP